MNRTSTAFLLAVASFSFAGMGPQTYQPYYDKISAAFAKNDVKVIDGFLASDYILIQPDGKQWTRDKVLEDFKRQMANMKSSKWVRKVKSAKQVGDLVELTVDGTFDGSFKDPQGKAHTFHLDSQSIDSWNKDHKLKKSQIVKLVPTMDGKPLPPMMGKGNGKSMHGG